MTDQPASLAEALALLQTQLPEIRKASKAQYGSYANLTDVSRELLPVMGKLGLSFTCTPTIRENGSFVLGYKLRHSASGEWTGGVYPLPAQGSPQQIGSAITYGRRYCLCAVTGAVAEEDDDGHAASQPAAKGRAKPSPRGKDELPRNADGSVSRSRTTDDELAATGQMTDQQIRDHGRLERDVKGTGPQGTQRLTETPADDPWYEQPDGHPAAAVRTPKSAPPVAGVIIMHFNRLGVTSRDERLQIAGQLAGRTDAIASTNALTASQGLAVKNALEKCKDRGALDALLDEEVPGAE